jgi:hypothetical protein
MYKEFVAVRLACWIRATLSCFEAHSTPPADKPVPSSFQGGEVREMVNTMSPVWLFTG